MTDWIEEGRKHFSNMLIHPGRPPANHPTQDIHTPKDEADFILGFKAAKGEHERGAKSSGLEAYAAESDSGRA